MRKKTSHGAVSKNSSSTTPAVSAGTQNAQKSSIFRSAFAPSRLQLALFASVIQGFESQIVRIHDTNTGRLRCQHSARPGTTITSLDWGYYVPNAEEQQQSSKRKRKRDQTKSENVVVAYGTSASEICMFSPAEGTIVGNLGEVHERGIKDFKFATSNRNEGWSIGGDGMLVQWDLNKSQPIRTIPLSDHSISVLAPPISESPQILCASSTPFTIDLKSINDFHIESYDSFKNPIHTLFRSGTENSQDMGAFLASDAGRYINIYDISQRRLLRTLIAGGDIEFIDFYSPGPEAKDALSQQLLSVVTKEGNVELFSKPFFHQKVVNGDLKSKSKSLTRKASAQVKLTDQATKANRVPIFNASLQGPELLVVTAQGGVDLAFQRVRWQDEDTGELLFHGIKEVAYKKAASTLNTVMTNGVKDTLKSDVDESRTVVVDGGAEGTSQAAAIAISSSEDEEDPASEGDEESEDASDGDDESADDEMQRSKGNEAHLAEEFDEEMQDATQGTAVAPDQQMQDAEAGSEVEEDEPTFGELLASRDHGMISIVDGLQPESSNLVPADGGKSLAMLSGISLATVLTQSLRTNDANLLESCFHATDADIVRSTIQRLDSSLAGILLSKLAERLSSRPGRYGHLLTWVQWTCIVHGGAIAGRPNVVSKIRMLYKVLTQRHDSLDPLLLLKGKLDMLDAQLNLRKEIRAQRQQRNPKDEEGIIYIEGQDNWSSDEDEAVGTKPLTRKGKQPRKALEDLISDLDSEEDDEDMPMTNGVLHSDSETEERDSDDEAEAHEPQENGLIDDEAEVSDEDSHPSDDEEDDSDEDDEEDSELDDFINDDSVSLAEEGDDIDIEGDDTPEKPAVKRVKRT